MVKMADSSKRHVTTYHYIVISIALSDLSYCTLDKLVHFILHNPMASHMFTIYCGTSK